MVLCVFQILCMVWTKPEVQAYHDLAKHKPKSIQRVQQLEFTKALPQFNLCIDKFLFAFSVSDYTKIILKIRNVISHGKLLPISLVKVFLSSVSVTLS